MPGSREKMDLLIVRENTEGFYADRNMYLGLAEFMPTPDVALSVRKITREGSRRIAKVAFDYAVRRRRRVAVVGKRHVLQMGDGLFVGEAQKLAARTARSSSGKWMSTPWPRISSCARSATT